MLYDYGVFKINQELFNNCLKEGTGFKIIANADMEYLYDLLNKRAELLLRNLELLGLLKHPTITAV